MDSDPLQAIANRLVPLVKDRLEWWRDAVLRWAADPPHYFDDDGFECGVLPIPFPDNATLTADDRIALLAAIHDACIVGGMKIDPWTTFLMPAGVGLSDGNHVAWGALNTRVPSLREHWDTHSAMVGLFLDEVERELLASAPKRRGRKKADYKTEQLENTLVADWKQARGSGVHKADFVADHKMTIPMFDTLLDRVAKRKKRSEK